MGWQTRFVAKVTSDVDTEGLRFNLDEAFRVERA